MKAAIFRNRIIGKCQTRHYCRHEKPSEGFNKMHLIGRKISQMFNGWVAEKKETQSSIGSKHLDGCIEDVREYSLFRKKLYDMYQSWMASLRKQRYSFRFASKPVKDQTYGEKDVAYEASESATNPSTCSSLALTTVPQILLIYPVNPLEEVLASYLLSIQPLLKPEEFNKEKKQTMDFLNAEGNELQKLLENVGRQEDNWLTSRWTKENYLSQRSPVTIFSSPCIAFPLQTFDSVHDFLQFTSQAIYAICDFKRLIEDDQIPVSTWESFTLDNSQLNNVFGTVRIPCTSCDILQQFPSNYVIVIYKNNFYKLDVFNSKGRLRSVPQLCQALQHIVHIGNVKGIEIGLLTHEPRDNWAQAHHTLYHRNGNRHVIKCIEKALFTVSLDQPIKVPKKNQQRTIMAAQLLHGGGLFENSANRWMDKALQLIVNPNGMAGFCCESSPADSVASTLIMDYVQRNIGNPDYGNDDFSLTQIYDPPCRLCFSQLDAQINYWLSKARRNTHKMCTHLQLHVFKFPCFGKYLLRTHDLPADSFVQMALQLAFYRLHEELPAQYEPAHLRIFKHGRTEAIRSTSNQSAAFIAAMSDNISSLSNRVSCLRTALNYHQEQSGLANHGFGVDRHMFGLKQMAIECGKPVPDFFYSKGYIQSQQYRINSAQLTTTHDAFMAIGPYTSDGYGCAYTPRQHDIIFAISSWKHKPKICSHKFGQEIERALVDMAQLILEAKCSNDTQEDSDCVKIENTF